MMILKNKSLQINSLKFIKNNVNKKFNLNFKFQRNIGVPSLISNQIFEMSKKMVPKMSETERAALNSGTVGFDRELLNGSATLKALSKYSVELTQKEKTFLETEVEQLCEMVEDYKVRQTKDLPENIWNFIKEKKFLGMIIPENYGGLGFSPHAHSLVVQKLAGRSSPVSVSVMVPNSLGPAELLMKYGTQEQKNHYLPRLANGQEIPCFALTGPPSGSDAASMVDQGYVCKNDKGELGVCVTFNKRYITLAPIATVVGLAFILNDPQNLLKQVPGITNVEDYGSEGITLALLPRDTPGLLVGDRHDPLNTPFMNGTVKGRDVWIPISYLIGGQKRAGYGWNMLMQCLSEGRGISLPASGVAIGKVSTIAMGAYARLRKQFKVSIADMEGIQERLATIASTTFTITSAQFLMNAILNSGERPSVLTAIMKQQVTERSRRIINEAMDIAGGSGICNGPNNLLASAYMAAPIAITVEGSNTLTRSLIIFGQGLVRSHPHLLDILESLRTNQPNEFNKALNQFLGHAFTNAKNSFTSAIKSLFNSKDYEAQLMRLAHNFAFCSDLCLTMGGKLKFAEMISGRMADVMGNLYLGFAILWYNKNYSNNSNNSEMDAVVQLAMTQILYETQQALYGVFDNFPNRETAILMKQVCFPLGATYKLPSDKLIKKAANLITTDSNVRKLLSQNLFISKNPNDRLHMLHNYLPKAIEADTIIERCRKSKTQPTSTEQKLIDEVEKIRDIIIQVDSFDFKLENSTSWELPEQSTVPQSQSQSQFVNVKRS
eukprot:TRINITY_DN203_c0_g2_i1.p1 TRINITY_DN203_c0_g2~~TRINITY_DN203_c0_g2_i1.p1  ORF type:complete len:786 (-),score=433.38 TRINITY_DN203_c0_g2_i1:19-2352(-)